MGIKVYFPYYKRLLKLALPLLFTQAGQMIVQLVDNAMVGRVGTAELAASSFAGSVFVIVMVFGIGVFYGITPLIGNAIGSNNRIKVAEMIKNGSFLSIAIVVGLFLIAYSVSFLMPFMNQPEEVWQLAVSYYRILTYSLIPFLLFMFLKQVGEGLGNTFWAMVATISSNIVNIVFNYLLIFGKLGFPAMGLDGAGWATLISRVILPVLLIIAFFYHKEIRQYFELWQQVEVRFSKFVDILKVGLPISIQMLMEVSLFAIGAVMMGWLGDVPLAAHQVALGLASFTFMTANGIAMATTIRVSFQLGNKAYKSMERVTSSAVHLVIVYMLLCGVIFYFFRGSLPKIFSVDPAVINQAASLLIIAAIFQLFDGLQVVGLGILRGFSDVKKPMLIAAFSYILIGLPISYFSAFVFDFGPEGIWMGFVAGLFAAGVLLSLRIKKKIKEIENL